METRLDNSWKAALSAEFEKPYFRQLIDFIRDEYSKQIVYPPFNQIFRALNTTPIHDVKVCILGQDPYHGPGQANGLCFSVNEGVKHPPSLVNIFKEIKSDPDISGVKASGDLETWAMQGVLLLNATLTVRAGEAGSHQKRGWEQFTEAVVKALNRERQDVVFMLWGAYAQKKAQLIDSERHLVLTSPHPSPLSAHRGFLGNRHFSQANNFLLAAGQMPIQW